MSYDWKPQPTLNDMKVKGFEAVNDPANDYGLFLHDGDFEKFQPYCYIKKNTIEYYQGCLIAEMEMTRALWIRQRFTTYLDIDWQEINSRFLFHFDMIIKLMDQIEALKKPI